MGHFPSFSIISHAKSPKAKSQSCDQGAQNEGMGPGCRSRLQSSQQIWWARESVPVAWGRNKASEAEMRSAGSYFNLRSASTAFIPKKVQPPGVAHQTECPASSLIDSAPPHVKITSELHLSPKSLRIIELYWADSACSEQSRFCNWVHFSSFLSTYAWTRLACYWEHVAQPMHWDDATRIFYINGCTVAYAYGRSGSIVTSDQKLSTVVWSAPKIIVIYRNKL